MSENHILSNLRIGYKNPVWRFFYESSLGQYAAYWNLIRGN